MPWRKMLQYFYWWLFWKLDLDTQAGAHIASAQHQTMEDPTIIHGEMSIQFEQVSLIAYFECFVI